MPAPKPEAAEERQPLNQVTLIKSGRWKSAIFTTFTFNAAFFEAYVLPRLHESGCEEVTVLVDELAYLASTAENPRHAGTAYRLVPVALSNGVFHAKLTYLRSADNNDLCMVGSGNLTWPGYGHRLECLDVMEASRDAQAFRDLATICRALLRRQDFKAGDAASILEALAARAESVAGAGAATAAVHILGPLEEPISTQVGRLLSGKKFRELVVVSPFHAPDGGPCRRLAGSLGIRKVRVAVDAANDTTPLEEDVDGVEYVRLDGEDRATHAKWYEFRGSESWLLSGSVNATNASLESIANFELATLRELPAARLPRWQAATPEEFSVRPAEFLSSPANQLALSVTARGRIASGAFVWNSDVDGKWRSELVQGGIRLPLASVMVNKGRFELELPGGLESEPCQFIMRQAHRTAVAWLMFENELRMSTAEREFARKVRRLSSPDAAPDDFIAVLGWLAERVGRMGAMGTTGASSATKRPDSDEGPAPDHKFDYAHWAIGAGHSHHAAHSLLGSCESALRALAQFTKSAAEGHAVDKEAGEDEFSEADNESADEPGTRGSEQRVVDALALLEKALRRSLEEGAHTQETATFILEALFWCLITQDRRNRQTNLDSVPFLQWTALAAPYTERFPQYQPLGELTLAVCACGFSVTSDSDVRRERFATMGRKASLNAGAGAPPFDLDAQLNNRPCFHVLRDEDRARAALAVEPMLKHEGFAAKLSAYLESCTPESRFGPPSSELVSQTGGLVSALVNKTRLQQPITHWKIGLPTRCSDRCYHQFDSSDMSVLRNRRAVRCIQCGRLHFWTGASA